MVMLDVSKVIEVYKSAKKAGEHCMIYQYLEVINQHDMLNKWVI